MFLKSKIIEKKRCKKRNEILGPDYMRRIMQRISDTKGIYLLLLRVSVLAGTRSVPAALIPLPLARTPYFTMQIRVGSYKD